MVENAKSAFWFHDGEITRFTEVMHAKVHTFIIMNELLVHYKVCHALAKGALLITRQQNFILVQVETNCRRLFKVHFKWEKMYHIG